MKATVAAAVAAAVISIGLAAPAQAVPNADRTEEELSCEILAQWVPSSIKDGVQLALMGIEGDTGMGQDDAVKFLWKSIDDDCPSLREPIQSWASRGKS
jgi:hypothetical protein